jgi:hypothetical protein
MDLIEPSCHCFLDPMKSGWFSAFPAWQLARPRVSYDPGTGQGFMKPEPASAENPLL